MPKSSRDNMEDVIEEESGSPAPPTKRGRGRPRKQTEDQAPVEIPSRDKAFEAAQQFFTLSVMIKQHDEAMKDAKKQKTQYGKVIKLYFEGNPEEDEVGQVECQRKSKKAPGASVEEMRQLVETEIMTDPLRTGKVLVTAIANRLDDADPDEVSTVSIHCNKESLEAAMGGLN